MTHPAKAVSPLRFATAIQSATGKCSRRRKEADSCGRLAGNNPPRYLGGYGSYVDCGAYKAGVTEDG